MRIRARLISLLAASLLLMITSVGLVGMAHNRARRLAIEQAMAAYPEAAAAVVSVFGTYFRSGHRLVIAMIAGLSVYFAYLFGRATVRQLDALRGAALRITAHQLDVPVHIEGNKQAEALARSLEHVRLALSERVALEERSRALEAELQSAEALHRLFLPKGARVAFRDISIESSLEIWPNGHFWSVRIASHSACLLVGHLEGSGPARGLLAAALLSTFRVQRHLSAPGPVLSDLAHRHRSLARGAGRLHAVVLEIDETYRARWASLGDAAVFALGEPWIDITERGMTRMPRIALTGLRQADAHPFVTLTQGEPTQGGT